MFDQKNNNIAVIGLGYVGLPLAVEFGKRTSVIGLDIDPRRIEELQNGHDTTLEVSKDELANSRNLSFTSEIEDTRKCNIYIVTVPTPITSSKQPDLKPLQSASQMIGKVLSKGDTAIFESTVYPGCTEEVCVPILENSSGLKFNEDFFVGYSPERINPGDKEHRLTTIKKVTSGSTPESATAIDGLYASIITAGTHKAPSIKVAEAAKVIENTQRDVNIALINELARIFHLLDIDTQDVLEAARTKWNFLPFRPGLVGGHCIGVDPYYLTHKAQSIGYHPEVILSGRRINDGMGAFVATQVVKLLNTKNTLTRGAKILILGLTFKENCPDIRNTKVVDTISELESFHAHVDVYDPWVRRSEVERQYPTINLVDQPNDKEYDAVILATAHDKFVDTGIEGVRAYVRDDGVVFDVKSALGRDGVDGRL